MRIIFLFVLTALVCAFGKPNVAARHVPTIDGRIYGGSPVNITQYPHQVSLLYNNYHDCAGSIISPKWILTAAHCVVNQQVERFSVRVGSAILESGGIIVDVSNIYYHAYYDEFTYDYDIAVVELSSMLTYTESIQAVQLPYHNQHINSGTMLTITGWGRTESGLLADQLLAVDVPVVSNPVCSVPYTAEGYEITERMLCAGYVEGGKDSCNGDSGGALVANNVQWGIVSWAYGCAVSEFYGVNTHVSNLRSWISQVTGV